MCQALSGPASTKMLYCVLLLHLGFIPAVAGFFIWRYVLLPRAFTSLYQADCLVRS